MSCPYECDGVWIETASGLMPCPRCVLEAHQRWLADTAANRRRHTIADRTRPTPTPGVHEARARIWSTIPRPTKET